MEKDEASLAPLDSYRSRSSGVSNGGRRDTLSLRGIFESYLPKILGNMQSQYQGLGEHGLVGGPQGMVPNPYIRT